MANCRNIEVAIVTFINAEVMQSVRFAVPSVILSVSRITAKAISRFH